MISDQVYDFYGKMKRTFWKKNGELMNIHEYANELNTFSDKIIKDVQ